MSVRRIRTKPPLPSKRIGRSLNRIRVLGSMTGKTAPKIDPRRLGMKALTTIVADPNAYRNLPRSQYSALVNIYNKRIDVEKARRNRKRRTLNDLPASKREVRRSIFPILNRRNVDKAVVMGAKVDPTRLSTRTLRTIVETVGTKAPSFKPVQESIKELKRRGVIPRTSKRTRRKK